MSARFIKAGPHTTIQDKGRWGSQSQGVPLSGAMDEAAVTLANLLVGNDRNSACLELASGLAELEFQDDSLIALTGLGLQAFSGRNEIPFYKPVCIKKGAVVKLKPTSMGSWSYLSTSGGWVSDKTLNSYSTYTLAGFGGFKGRRLKDGDQLVCDSMKSSIIKIVENSHSHPDESFHAARWSVAQSSSPNNDPIRIFAGHELNWLSKRQQEVFQESYFSISPDANRMGYRLSGPKLKTDNHLEMISSAVTKGTVQLTHNGDLIVLLADSQTVGGYPKVGQVISTDLPKLVQKRTGQTLQFKLISFEEAETLFLIQERELRQLELGIKYKFTS